MNITYNNLCSYDIEASVNGFLGPDTLDRLYAVGVSRTDGSQDNRYVSADGVFSEYADLFPFVDAVSELRDRRGIDPPMDPAALWGRMQWSGERMDDGETPDIHTHVALCEKPAPKIGRALAYLALGTSGPHDLVVPEIAVCRSVVYDRSFRRVLAALFQATLDGIDSSQDDRTRVLVWSDAPTEEGKVAMRKLSFEYSDLEDAFVAPREELYAAVSNELEISASESVVDPAVKG